MTPPASLSRHTTHNATHFAMATKLSKKKVILRSATRQGWPAKYRKRGGVLGVIEIFVEGCQMIEVLTDEMQREYVGAITIEKSLGMLETATWPAPPDRPHRFPRP